MSLTESGSSITSFVCCVLNYCYRGIRAGAAVNIDNYIFERELSQKYEPNREIVHQGTFRLIHVVLDAAAALATDTTATTNKTN